MKRIGITETYDPVFVHDWESRLVEGNIIISKELSFEMMDKLIENKDKIIFHHSITGLGETQFEPEVRNWGYEFEKFKLLISKGFPISHYVLRIDPIVPFINISKLEIPKILTSYSNYLSNYNIDTKLRVRVSMIDLYPHVRERFRNIGITVPNSFHLDDSYFREFERLFTIFKDKLDFYSCGELKFDPNIVRKDSCVSELDLDILGLDKSEYNKPSKPQRLVCNCLSKVQILGVKPGRCPHNCIYCYWKDK